jgi:threonine-phosphate decarboxylase
MKKWDHGGNCYDIEKKYGISAGSLLDFSVNLNPLGMPPSVRRMIFNSVEEILFYPDMEYRECREAIAAYHTIPASWVTAGNGATEIIFLYCRSVKPLRALMLAPTFSEYHRALDAVGAAVTYFEMKESTRFTIDFDALFKEILNGYDLVVICNPNNPTGTLLTKNEILKVASHCSASGCRLLVDESFIEFVSNSPQQFSVIGDCMPENVNVVRSLTKIFSIPGLRFGYGVCSDAVLNQILVEKKEPWSINTFAARCGYVLSSEKDYLENTRRIVADENKFLFDALQRFSWLTVYPSPVNYMLVKITDHLDAMRLVDELLKHSILIRDASNFVFLDERFVRIAVKDHASNLALVHALENISCSL